MEIIGGDELAHRYEEVIERAAADERIIVSHAGKQVAIVSFDDLTFLEEVDRKLDERYTEEAKRRLADLADAPVTFVPTTLTPESSAD